MSNLKDWHQGTGIVLDMGESTQLSPSVTQEPRALYTLEAKIAKHYSQQSHEDPSYDLDGYNMAIGAKVWGLNPCLIALLERLLGVKHHPLEQLGAVFYQKFWSWP